MPNRSNLSQSRASKLEDKMTRERLLSLETDRAASSSNLAATKGGGAGGHSSGVALPGRSSASFTIGAAASAAASGGIFAHNATMTLGGKKGATGAGSGAGGGAGACGPTPFGAGFGRMTKPRSTSGAAQPEPVAATPATTATFAPASPARGALPTHASNGSSSDQGGDSGPPSGQVMPHPPASPSRHAPPHLNLIGRRRRGDSDAASSPKGAAAAGAAAGGPGTPTGRGTPVIPPGVLGASVSAPLPRLPTVWLDPPGSSESSRSPSGSGAATPTPLAARAPGWAAAAVGQQLLLPRNAPWHLPAGLPGGHVSTSVSMSSDQVQLQLHRKVLDAKLRRSSVDESMLQSHCSAPMLAIQDLDSPELQPHPSLPQLAERAKRSSLCLPSIAGSPKAQTGFLERPVRAAPTAASVEVDDDRPMFVPTVNRNAGFYISKSTYDKSAFHPSREDDVLHIATNIGLVTREATTVQPPTAPTAATALTASASSSSLASGPTPPKAVPAASRLGPGSGTASPARGTSVTPVPSAAAAAAAAKNGGDTYVSVQGVQLSVLMRMADTACPPGSGDVPVSEVVRKQVIPATSQHRCRYIDIVAPKLVGAADYYIMHSWQAGFAATIRTMHRFLVTLCKRKAEDVYCWMDVVCVNQHMGPAREADLTAIQDAIRTVPQALLVLDSAGTALSRTWIHFEVWRWAQQPPPSANNSIVASSPLEKLAILPVSWDWGPLHHPWLMMDAEKSVTTEPSHRGMLVGAMVRGGQTSLSGLTAQIKGFLLTAARYEMNRAELHANLTPRRFLHAATAYAMLLYQSFRLNEAEDVMLAAKVVVNKQSNMRELTQQDEASCLLHLATIKREKGQLSDAEQWLQIVNSLLRERPGEMFLHAASQLVDVQRELKMYTKAEMLCRKVMELCDKLHSTKNTYKPKHLIQLAHISMAQHIYEEAEGHADGAAHLSAHLHGADSLEAASCYHVLAECCFHTNQQDRGEQLMAHAQHIRERTLGNEHPLTLQIKADRARLMFMAQAGYSREAETLMEQVFKTRTRLFGIEHHDTLESLGQLANLYAAGDRMDEAMAAEKQMLDTGRMLLRQHKIDRFRSLRLISQHLVGKEHLMDKASMFLAKAFVAYREKLGQEAELTISTRQQLLDIVESLRDSAGQALDNAEIFHVQEQYQVAELLFQQALSLSKLLEPDGDHKQLAQHLADALFGQGKALEAKTVLRAAGIVKQGMKSAIPASYLRWLNMRVEKYMDKKSSMEPVNGEDPYGEGDDDESVPGTAQAQAM